MNEMLIQIMQESPTMLVCDDITLVYDEDGGAWVVRNQDSGRVWRFEDFTDALQSYAELVGFALLMLPMPSVVEA